ncbi:MAG: Gfo/Idh/MocA family protein [Marmoricola sp.]
MTLRVGLVGAGPWAGTWQAPMLARGPGTTLTAVWARRSEAATALAEEFDAVAAASYDELLERSDAVAFAVPPDVQAELAVRAAAAGRHLLLEKPLAFTLAKAERLAEAVDAAGVQSLVMLRNRFSPAGRRFLADLASGRAYGAQASVVSGAALPGAFFATPWRVARGALLDLGPHVLDLLDAALGPVTDITAVGDPRTWLALTTVHEGGAIGQAALSITTPGGSGELGCRVVTDHGEVTFDGAADPEGDAETARTIAAAFAGTVSSGEAHPLDVHRGVYLQRLLDRAAVEGTVP